MYSEQCTFICIRSFKKGGLEIARDKINPKQFLFGSFKVTERMKNKFE